METTTFPAFSITARGRLFEFRRPAVMGILNATADSFYDGGRYLSPDALVSHAREMVDLGADIVDIGAASSRPGATLPPPADEARRLAAAVEAVRHALPDVLISADTCFSLPARAAVEAGADIINDIGGGDLDPAMFATVADLQVPYVLMHGASRHFSPTPPPPLTDPVEAIAMFLSCRLDSLYSLGVKDVWIDPGFGFGNDTRTDLFILSRLRELSSLFREPLLAGLSRKRMTYLPLGISPSEALCPTVALDTLALDRGARILRVHDVLPASQTVKLLYPDSL